MSGQLPGKLSIRLETEADHRSVEMLTREAFWNLYRPGCDEHYTTHLIHGHDDYLPDLTFVAEVDGELVGSIVYTRSFLVNEQTGQRAETATFGPLCVHPAWQRKGVGAALIQHTKALATQKGYAAIAILGDPHNYCKHGFQTGRDLNVCMSGGRYPLGLLVLPLRQGFFDASASASEAPARWTLHISPVFEFDPAAAEAYDARFPPREKRHQWSQDLFSMLVRSVVE
ncbi:N-acetyltransferase [Hydrogenophaga sp. 5NK40-0174]|uniref:GNAT family N-acetyltransferase n=1 Tax=Hydrogenophaga sp. 5NK40-0174 TaxID=3127649 RepID=UPI003107C82D